MQAIDWNIKARPVRIWFLVDEWNILDLVKCAWINSLLWGWIYNPIIPIKSEDNSFSDSLIELFDVDFLYPIKNDSENINKFLENNKDLVISDLRWCDDIFEDSNKKKWAKIINYLDLIDIVNYYYQNEFKHEKKNFKSNVTNIIWDDSDINSNVYSILFWFIPNDIGFERDYKKAFIKWLFAKEFKIDIWNEKLDILEDKISLIQITWLNLEHTERHDFSNKYWIYFWNSDNFNDLLNFWNLRAWWIHITFNEVNNNIFDKTTELLITKVNKYNKSDFECINLFHGWEIDLDLVSKKVDALKSKIRFVYSCVSVISYNGLNIKPNKYYFDSWIWVIGHLDISWTWAGIKLPLTRNKLFIEDYKKIVFCVSCSLWYKNNEYSTNLPVLRKLNTLYRFMNHWLLKNSLEWLEFLWNVNDFSIHFSPILKYNIFKEIYKLIWTEIELSKSWVQTNKLIEKLWEWIKDLEWSRIFKIKWVRNLIKEMKKPDSIKTKWDISSIIYDAWGFKKYEGLYIERRDTNKLTKDDAFNYLLKNDLFKAWLELKCNSCNLENWVSLKHLDDKWTCEYCWNIDITSLKLKDRWDWRFRKSWLLWKNNNQEWAIPVILTLLAFKNVLDNYFNFLYLTSFNIKFVDWTSFESDFCIIDNDDLKLNIVIWEVKDDWWIIEQNDINNLIKISDEFYKIWIECYIVFSKTSETFKDEEIELFKKVDKKYRLILLTSKELEAYHLFSDYDNEDKLPDRYSRNLNWVWRNSNYIYLKN